MGLIIDTNVFIHSERSGHNIDFSRWVNHGEAAISVVTASELLVGADSEARRQKRLAFVESILAQIPIRDFTIAIARVHAELFAMLARQGQMIGAHVSHGSESGDAVGARASLANHEKHEEPRKSSLCVNGSLIRRLGGSWRSRVSRPLRGFVDVDYSCSETRPTIDRLAQLAVSLRSPSKWNSRYVLVSG